MIARGQKYSDLKLGNWFVQFAQVKKKARKLSVDNIAAAVSYFTKWNFSMSKIGHGQMTQIIFCKCSLFQTMS